MMTPFSSKPIKKLAAVATAALGLSATSAQAITLQDLFNGGSISLGNVSFTDWQFNTVDSSASPGFEPDFSLIDVQAFQSGNKVGLRYTALSGGAVTDDNSIETFFNYKATAGTGLFIGAEVELTDFSITGAGGSINIIDDISDSTFSPVALIAAFSDNAVGDQLLLDTISFAPTALLNIEKAVLVRGDFPGDNVLLNSFEQRYTLQAPVPEPATLWASAMGTFTLAILWQRIRSKTVLA